MEELLQQWGKLCAIKLEKAYFSCPMQHTSILITTAHYKDVSILGEQKCSIVLFIAKGQKQGNVGDVRENPRPEALANHLKVHTHSVLGFFSPPPHWSSYTLKFKSDGEPSGRLKPVISRLTRK